MPRSGELLRIATPGAVLALLGPLSVPRYGVTADDVGRQQEFAIGGATVERPTVNMGFFDDVPYTLQVSALEPMEVTQNYRPLDLTWVHHGALYMATTTVQFRQVGWTEFRMGQDGVRIHIQSRKMDYESDYREMIRDLENQVRGLTAKLVSDGLEGMVSAPDGPTDLWSYWLSVLEVIWERLARDATQAWKTLPMRLTIEERRTYLDLLKAPKHRDIGAYSRTGDSRISSLVRVWNPLIVERLYILQLLYDIHRRLDRVMARAPELKDNVRLNLIMHDVSILARRLSTEVGMERVTGSPRVPSSPLGQSHPALRQVIAWHRLLQSGLFPNGDRFFVGIKDLHLLYEYWCYLTIVRMVVEESRGTLKVYPVVSADPMDIVLSSGSKNSAQVQLPNGETVFIRYERQFSGLPTIAQKPDHVVELTGLGPMLIFDAKYRFEINHDYIAHYGHGDPIPPVDTINGMHQYHDAIVRIHPPYERLVNRAIVLFPLPRGFISSWRQHRFYQSIESVGVGALPLLPGGDDAYVRDEIRRYLKLK